ncbi:MAG: molybdenum cofactor cytidylyltransferase [Sedimentisphaerales bacterium]|jgi:molybdenum cofactor cytidylyltransferase
MICGVVLAAGCSRRMGAQKLLLPFAGKTVVEHIVDQLLASKLDEVHVVVGNQAQKVTKALSERPVSVVTNAQYESGMLSSVRCALRNLRQECRTVLVALGDQPSVTRELIDKMLQAFAAAGKRILVPSCNGKRGHPVMFSTAYRSEILASYDDVGLRGLLRAHSDDVFELEVPNSSVLSDMDYPEDYHREVASIE